MKPFLIAALTTSLAATLCPASAFAKDYACKIAAGAESLGWLPTEVSVKHGDSVMVDDPLIQQLVGKPVEGALSRENANVIVFTWEVAATDGENQHARLKYRLTVQKADGRAQISGTPLGYANSFTAQGACKAN